MSRASEEVLIPFPVGADPRAMVQEVRSTIIATSLATLRRTGTFDAYLEKLTPEYRESIPLAALATAWLPMQVALVHFTAVDALGLSTQDVLERGASITGRLSPLLMLARSSGVTVWTALGQFQRLFDTNFRGGGGVRVLKLGPKEARMEIRGLPLARIAYFRSVYRGFLQGAGQRFCTRIYVTEVTNMCTSTTLAYRAAWA